MQHEHFKFKFDRWSEEVSDECHKIAIRNDEYPDFYVFQSDVIESPDLLIVGANPGGFKKYSEILKDKGIERRTKNHLGYGSNQYIEHPEWKISKPILKIFENPEMHEILKNAVIINAIYFNTAKVSDLRKFADGDEMIKLCKQKTKEFIYEILKPKNILFIGMDAPKWIDVNYNILKDGTLRNDENLWLVQELQLNEIPHYMIHHTSRNYSLNNAKNTDMKREFFEKKFIDKETNKI